jgi:hypothetical protein
VRNNLTRRLVLGTGAGILFGSYGACAAPRRIRTVIGTGVQGHVPDGASVRTATLNQPYGVYVDQANTLYWADFGSDRVLMLRRGSATVSVVAGNGIKGHSGDNGPAKSAQLSAPHEVRFDRRGNMLVAERDANVIRRIDRRSGSISTLVGTGTPGFSGDGGPSEKAQLKQPHSIALDRNDNLYICDIQNNRVRCRDAATGLLTTFAGNGEVADTPDEAPLTASLHGPRSIDIGPDGTMYLILREGNKVFSIDPAGKTLKRIAGTARKAMPVTRVRRAMRYGMDPKALPIRPTAISTFRTPKTTSSAESRCRTAMLTRSRGQDSAVTGRMAIRWAVLWHAPTASMSIVAFSTSEIQRTIASVRWKSDQRRVPANKRTTPNGCCDLESRFCRAKRLVTSDRPQSPRARLYAAHPLPGALLPGA